MFLKNKFLKFLFLHIHLVIALPLFPIRGDELHTAIKKFQYSTFYANFNLEWDNQTITGKIYYQNTNIHIKLNDGRIIASNLKNIIVYDPQTKVSGKQDKISGGGLEWVLKYPYELEGNKAIILPDNENPYKKIIIIWNQDFFPTTIQFISEKITITYRFSNIVFLNNISSNYFSYKPPAGSRSVENPLNIKK